MDYPIRKEQSTRIAYNIRYVVIEEERDSDPPENTPFEGAHS